MASVWPTTESKSSKAGEIKQSTTPSTTGAITQGPSHRTFVTQHGPSAASSVVVQDASSTTSFLRSPQAPLRSTTPVLGKPSLKRSQTQSAWRTTTTRNARSTSIPPETGGEGISAQELASSLSADGEPGFPEAKASFTATARSQSSAGASAADVLRGVIDELGELLAAIQEDDASEGSESCDGSDEDDAMSTANAECD